MTTRDEQFRLALKLILDQLVEKMNQPGAAEATEKALFGDTLVDKPRTEESLQEMKRIAQEMGFYDLEENALIKEPDEIRFHPDKE